MAKKGSFSKVYDKNGDYVDVEAARFDGTRSFQMQGDVTASQTWNGDPSTPLTLNASIGAKKVTTDKINDKAVGTAQLADDAVGLTQIDDNAMTSAATSGDDRLITSGGVRTEIDNAILNRGKDYGPMTPTQINAISETIPTGSTVHVTAAGTITDGDIEVRQGEDLKYYRGNGEHYWYSMDGDFKLKQQAKTSPTASGNALSFIDSITQDENGEISATKKTVQDGTTSQKGVVQLEDSHSSTSTTKAATPNSVKEAYDLANTANTGAVKNVAYDSTNKKITKTINGQTTDVVSAATLKTDMALNNVDNTSDANKPVSTAQQAALDLKLDKTGDGKDVTATFTEASTRANIGTGEKLSVIFGKIKKWFSDLKALAFKDKVGDGDIDGTITDTHISSASAWNGKYDKPSGGIPKTDLASGVQTSLGKADSAIQGVKVNNTTLTPDANKVVTVPLATTSADGAMSAAEKTKLDGIAEGAEVNVQADWDETDSSSDAFIKNKPFYSKSIGETAAIFKVCLFPIYGSSSVSSGSSIDVQFRYGNGSVFGRLSYKNGFKLTLTKISELATSRYIRFFYVVGDVVDIYAQATNSYLEFKAAPSMNMPKTSVNFSNFGTVVSALPEGATEITPVWVANASASSGTAPVKVDEYGGLTPVPMDSTPTASSTNLMTSGDIKTALDAISTTVYPWYRIGGGGTEILKKICDLAISNTNNYNGWSFVFDYAMEYKSLQQKSSFGTIELQVKTTGTNEPSYSVIVRPDSGPKESRIIPKISFYTKWENNRLDAVIAASTGGVYYNGLAVRIRSCIKQDGSDISSYVTLAANTEYTPGTGYSEKTNVVTNLYSAYVNGSGVGSASVPVFVNANGAVIACTDDFVHDGDVAQTYSSTSEAPISGKGVSAAISGKQDSSKDIVRFDAKVSYIGNTTIGWYKVAEATYNTTTSSFVSSWLVNVAGDVNTWGLQTYTLQLYVRTSSSGNNASIWEFKVLNPDSSDSGSYPTFKAVLVGKSGNLKIQIWYLPYKTYGSMMMSELVSGSYVMSETKSAWTYTSYSEQNGQSEAPTGDVEKNVDFITAVNKNDVTSTYSSTGTAPVNGTAVASAISTKQDTLSFMTTDEAHSLWTNAKANAS